MSDLPQKCFYQDGDYTSPVLIWTSPKRYPLAADGDVTTYEYTRRYLVAWESWVPTQLGTVDPLDSTAFLVREEPPAGGRNPLSEFERVYCRVPSRITKASSVMFSPPNPPVETGAWNSLYFTATNGATNVYYMRTCTDSGLTSAPTGGTFTLTLNGQTTSALAHNASAATIQTALRALSSATNWGTGLTVTGSASVTTQTSIFFSTPFRIRLRRKSDLVVAVDNTVNTAFYNFGKTNFPLWGSNCSGVWLSAVFSNMGSSVFNSTIYDIKVSVFGQETAWLDVSGLTLAQGAKVFYDAINALSNVSSWGGVVSVGGDVCFLFAAPVFSSSSSLTGASSPYSIIFSGLSISSGASFIIFSGGRLLTTSTPHLGKEDSRIIAKVGSTYTEGDTYDLDSDTIIRVPTTYAPFNNASTITEVGTLQMAFGGALRFKITEETDFFLTGPDPSATTVEQIQPTTQALTWFRFYNAINNGDATVTLDETDVKQWSGPIYHKTKTTLSLEGQA